jgi:hypothetical protein
MDQIMDGQGAALFLGDLSGLFGAALSCPASLREWAADSPAKKESPQGFAPCGLSGLTFSASLLEYSAKDVHVRSLDLLDPRLLCL